MKGIVFVSKTSCKNCNSAVFTKVGYLLIFTLIVGLAEMLTIISSSPTSAISLSLSLVDVVSLDLVGASSTSGVFASSSTSETIISVKTDNYTGYTLGIAASNSSVTALTNTSDSNITIPSITSSVDESTFSSSTSYNNKWGYKPSKFNSVDNTNYLPAPSASTSSPDTLDQTSSPNPTTANTYNIAIGARVNNTTAPGTYTNSYVITAVANGTPYTLTYNKNAGSDTVSNMPTNITNGVSYADTINLGTTTPTRTGYTFAGWCTSNASQTSCSSTLYNSTNGNLASFPIDRTASSNSLNVYAIWTSNPYSITLTNTNATTAGSTSARALYGTSTVYGGTSGTSAITAPQRSYSFSGFTKTNSAYNATVSATTTKTYTYTFDGWYTAASGGYKVINANGTLVASAPNGTATLTNSSSQWISTSGTTLYAHWTAGTNQTLPTITQADSTNGNGNCYWSSSNSTTGAQTYTSGATISSPTAGATLYGVCKFPVKITFAGSGVSSVAVKSGSASGTTVGTVSSSGGSVTNLQYGTTYYLVPTFSSGYELDNWKKTSARGALAGTTTQNTTSTTVNPTLTIGATTTTGSVGITVTGKASKIYIQDFTKSQCSSLASSANFTVYDRRDEQAYTVRYLANACWMTRNLAIGCNGSGSSYGNSVSSKSLTSTYSNISSTWSTPTTLLTDGVYNNSTRGYSNGAMLCSSTYGAWYNYAAATAETITGASNTTNDTYNICPKNWTIPGNGSSTGQVGSITSYSTAFSPTAGGYYQNGSINNPTNGYWWTATYGGVSDRYFLRWSGNNLVSNYYDKRYLGYFVRCVRTT